MTDGHSSPTRRQILGGLGSALAFGHLPAAVVAGPPPPDLRFVALRDGSRIGHHRVNFLQQGDRLLVDIEIQFEVTFAFIPLYRYRHRNREVWEGDRLVELDARTDDDGLEHWVRAEAQGGRLMVTSSEGGLDLPGETATTSYWNEASLGSGAWLDTQSGRLVRSTVEPHPPEPIRAGGREVEAKRYALAGDIDCHLWYHQGRWVGLRFEASDGSTIHYEA